MRDRVLVLDDVKLDRKRQHREARRSFDRHDGREGDALLINGQREPELEIAAGQIERWRIVNACSARYVRLSLGGRPFRIIGSDGGLRRRAGDGDRDAADARRSRRARRRPVRRRGRDDRDRVPAVPPHAR